MPMYFTGESDAHNRDECVRVVEARPATIPRSSDEADGGDITLAHASPELHRMVELPGWRHPRLTIDPPVDNPSIGTEVDS